MGAHMESMTYVFCVVRSSKPPRLARVPRGLPGMGAARLLTIARGLYAVVADAPANRYSEAAINRGLTNINWVSTAAVAHERIVEHFINAPAVLPMKLFTIFISDERALEYLRSERARLASTAKRVAYQREWGLRVLLDRARAAAVAAKGAKPVPARKGGLAYLAEKKASRDAATELAVRAQDTVARLYERLAAKARDARRRSAAELPAQGSLLLDAAFLVPKSRSTSFRQLATRESRALAPHGYAVTLSGPWPPYTFVQES